MKHSPLSPRTGERGATPPKVAPQPIPAIWHSEGVDYRLVAGEAYWAARAAMKARTARVACGMGDF